MPKMPPGQHDEISELTAAEALQLSQDKYRAMVDNVGIGVALISPEMQILELNRQMREWFPQVDSDTRPICYQAFNNPPRTDVCGYCPTCKTLLDGEVHESVTDTPTPEGMRNYRIISSPVFDADGKVTAAIEMVEDITERRVLEAQLAHARKLESVGQLAAGIAHEINTPTQFVNDNVHFLKEALEDITELLGAYQLAVESLARGDEATAVRSSLQEAEEGADLEFLEQNMPTSLESCLQGLSRISVIVGALKEFAHPDQREMVPADINKALSTTLTIARNEYRFVADVQTDFGQLPAVQCHLGDLNQVFLNLIVNAAHAIEEKHTGTSERGSILVHTASEGDWVRIEISDTGNGVPEEIRERIFDPFYTTKELGKGSGQGLAIAHSIVVDKHGGTIVLHSEPGAGARLVIRLPCQAAVGP